MQRFRIITLALWCLVSAAGQVYYVAPISDTGLPGETLGPYRGYYGPATVARLATSRVAVGADGSVYVLDGDAIVRVTPEGTLIPVTGRGGGGSGDGGPAVAATLDSPGGIAVDAAGNLYVVSSGAGGLRRITPNGLIDTLSPYPTGTGLALGPDGNLYVAGSANIWKVTPQGQTSIEAGVGQPGFPPRWAIDIDAFDIAVDTQRNLFIAEYTRSRIRKIQPDGSIVVIVGSDTGDAPANLRGSPSSVAVDDAGAIYYGAGRLRKVGPDLEPQPIDLIWDHCEQGRVLPVVEDIQATEVAIGPEGNVYATNATVPDLGQGLVTDSVLRIDTDGVVYHVAGCLSADCHSEGRTVRRARIQRPRGLEFDSQGNLFTVSSRESYVDVSGDNRVWRIGPDFSVAGPIGYEPGCSILYRGFASRPRDITVDTAANLFVSLGTSVDRIRPDGSVEWFAGMRNSQTPGDTPATQVRMDAANGLAVDTAGNLMIGALPGLFRVSPESEIELVFSAEENPGTGFFSPRGLTPRPDGSLLAAGPEMHRVIAVTPNQGWQPFAGTGQPGTTGDDGPAVEARLAGPLSTAIDPAGNTYIADTVMRRVDPGGIIHAFELRDARNNSLTVSLDAKAIAADAQGRLYLATDDGLYVAASSPAVLPNFGPSVHWSGAVHGATFEFKAVAPGEIMSVFGIGVGPDEPAEGIINDDVLATELAGYRVLFDGEAAPVLHAQNDQINCIAPFSLSGKSVVTIEVERDGRRSNRVRLPVVEAAPGVFEVRSFQAAILNQDYSLHSPENPAHPGEVLMVYAAGFGETTPPGEDGRIYGDELPRTARPVTASIGGLPADVLYSGAAPGLVAGATQVNVRVPDGLFLPEDGRVPLVIRVGGAPTQSRTRIFVEDVQ